MSDVQTGRRWTVRVPACEWLTANDRRRGLAVSGIVRDWRTSVATACLAAHLPTDGCGPVSIHAAVRYAGARPPVRDKLNLAPTLKAIVDGLVAPKLYKRGDKLMRTVGYGLLADDSDRHVRDITWDIEPSGGPRAWVDLTITEVAGDG